MNGDLTHHPTIHLVRTLRPYSMYGHYAEPMPGPRRSRGAQGSAATTADPRGRILTATRQLLDARRFDTLSVADILAEASVSRASFYFYFASKQEVLAELVRAAVQEGQEAAEPWLQEQLEPRA